MNIITLLCRFSSQQRAMNYIVCMSNRIRNTALCNIYSLCLIYFAYVLQFKFDISQTPVSNELYCLLSSLMTTTIVFYKRCQTNSVLFRENIIKNISWYKSYNRNMNIGLAIMSCIGKYR